MKKIYGVFRGFPGLGRVSSGIALLQEFQNMEYEIAGISYLQGQEALRKQNVSQLFKYKIEPCDITSIGINPITGFANKIIEMIIKNQPDMVIIDGEPLLESTLCDVYPKEKIIALLNPTDLENETLPVSTMKFYHKNYLSASNAIVHGIGIKNANKIYKGCNINYIATILRKEVVDIAHSTTFTNRIIGVLGGGTVNSSRSFADSTISMGRKIIEIGKMLSDYEFYVYCNDYSIKRAIEKNVSVPANTNIVAEYVSPAVMYSNIRLVIARAGRNVISELLYLNIPGLLIATSGDYRSKEQEKNINMIINESNNLFDKFNIDDDTSILADKILLKLKEKKHTSGFIPGNDHAIHIIKSILEV